MSDQQQQSGIDRRRFLTVVGTAGAGAAVLSGCSTEKVQKLVPYLVQSEDQIPGLATYYASTCTECSAGCGMHVKTREGRAIKVDGNVEHPVNGGALCARGQATLQGLYNPGRVKSPALRQADGTFKDITWDEAVTLLATKLGTAGANVVAINGAGRGSFTTLLDSLVGAVGGSVASYEPFDFAPLKAAHLQVFGKAEIPAHDFAAAKCICSFGADFLETWVSPVENARGFAISHGAGTGTMSKHMYFAPRASLTGLNADEWHAINPGTEAVVALAMAKLVLEAKIGPAEAQSLAGALAPYTTEMAAKASGLTAAAIEHCAMEMIEARPSLAVAGGVGSQHEQAVEVAAAVAMLNYVAGNIGQTVKFGADLQGGDGLGPIEAALEKMAAGTVQVALVTGNANPAGTLPLARGFRDAFKKVPFKVAASLYHDDTTALCDLLIPNHHALERWDDVWPRAGVYGLTQAVMEPVNTTRNTGDVLLQVAKKVGGAMGAAASAPDYDAYLKANWAPLATAAGRADFDVWWRETAARGGVYGTAPTAAVTLATSTVSFTEPTLQGTGDLTFVAYASPLMYDGRGTNRPWLQENPDPTTKIMWHPWVEVHPETAKALNVREGEHLIVTGPGGVLEAPAYITPGIKPGVVSAPLGYGQSHYGFMSTGYFSREGRGANAFDILPSGKGAAFQSYVVKATVVRHASNWTRVAKSEGNPRQLGRHIAEAMTAEHAGKGLTVKQAYEALGGHTHEINTEREIEAIEGWREGQVGTKDGEGRRLGNYAGEHAMWGMAVDLAKCTGCSACVTACYAENNIAVVGEEQVTRGREMSWMRIERYWEGGEDGTPIEARFVPVMCQHCDNAPCEPVCPVYAAYHTPDGLNGQVYNRCVGTRYCANNCPYKVRYFNWLKYNDFAWPEPLNLQLNPEVTVRARGVMEKCTFCIQRIRITSTNVKLEGRDLKDDDIMTACQQACPSNAISFGDMHAPDAKVNVIKASHRGYHILEEINVLPAVTYLAKVTTRPLTLAGAHGGGADAGAAANTGGGEAH